MSVDGDTIVKEAGRVFSRPLCVCCRVRVSVCCRRTQLQQRGLEMRRKKIRRRSYHSRPTFIDDSCLLKIHQLANSLKSIPSDSSVSAPDTPTALAAVNGDSRQLLISAAQRQAAAVAVAVGAAAAAAAAANESESFSDAETDSDEDNSKDGQVDSLRSGSVVEWLVSRSGSVAERAMASTGSVSESTGSEEEVEWMTVTGGSEADGNTNRYSVSNDEADSDKGDNEDEDNDNNTDENKDNNKDDNNDENTDKNKDENKNKHID